MSDTPNSEDAPQGESTESSHDDLAENTHTSAPAPQGQGFGEWLWRGQALRDARDSTEHLSPKQRARLQRARAAAELGDRALDPIDPLRHGSSIPFALSLYREAAYWALLAQDDEMDASSLRDAFTLSDEELLLAAVNSPEELSAIRRILCDQDFIAAADIPLSQQEPEARAVSLFLRAILSQPDQNEWAAQRLLLQRWSRILGLLVLIAGLIAGAVFGLMRLKKKTDLAAGKPWRTSSSGLTCYPQRHQCGTAHTDILFHTQEEENPWFELDLKAPTAFTQIEVYNRTDCCPDRAVPLALEVSNDKQHWKEIARRNETFGTWTATFAEQKMRYIRARSLRRTTLHLEGMSVR